jgi:hypothetical protein
LKSDPSVGHAAGADARSMQETSQSSQNGVSSINGDYVYSVTGQQYFLKTNFLLNGKTSQDRFPCNEAYQ